MTAVSRRRRGRLAAAEGAAGGVMITAMMRLVRGTPVVRCLASAMAAILLLCGLIPIGAYGLLRLDAAAYAGAIGDRAKECPGDPIPARGGCWSAAPVRVTVSGVDAQTEASFVVVDAPGAPPAREDFVITPPVRIATGTTLTARYWQASIAELLLPAGDAGAAPTALPTRDNPQYRAQTVPVASALLTLVSIGGLLVWGLPLVDDLRQLRRRRRMQAEAEAEALESLRAAGQNRGLARYGIDLGAAGPADGVVLTGHRAAGVRER
ncbi:MAG TPA: hypothetical protein VFC09_15275 [Candidatus Dormibacteraeota bacterium]|nr:hypothetical protein [Candidatus Dormibacteraeota bacterium]